MYKDRRDMFLNNLGIPETSTYVQNPGHTNTENYYVPSVTWTEKDGTSKTSNYKSHLQAKHKNEFTIFLQTALNNTKNSDNLNYDYKESNDSNQSNFYYDIQK